MDGVVKLDATFDPVGGEIFGSELERIEKQLFEADWAEAKALFGERVTAYHLKRTSTQRRCDAFVEMAKRSIALPEGSKLPRPLFTVVAGVEEFNSICKLENGGAIITAGTAAKWLTDAMFETIVFSGRKRAISLSRRRNYTGALRRVLDIRDRHCQHESRCDVRAAKCEGDHDLAWSKGGPISEENGKLRCRPHNRAKGSGPP